MIVKLVYQDWIHRVTDIPSHFSDLRGVIISSFKTTLPEGFTLSYTIAGQVENVPLVTEEDYQALLALEPSTKSVKIIVSGERKPSGDYDVIAQTKPGDYQPEERKIEKDLEGFVENVSESVIIPQVSQVQQKYPYISSAQDQNNENIRKIVREVLKEQLPTIVSQVKDAVLKELRPLMPVYHEPAQPPKVQQQQQQRPQIYEVEDRIDINPVPGEVIFERSEDVYGREENNVPAAQAGGQNDLLDKMKKFGNALKDQLVVLPGKAKDAFDDLSQKLEGDPYITCEEGKYPKSVVEKANLLREIFPEEEKKVLLEFVKRYPRHATLEQLANLYLVKDEPPQEAAGGEGQNNNA